MDEDADDFWTHDDAPTTTTAPHDVVPPLAAHDGLYDGEEDDDVWHSEPLYEHHDDDDDGGQPLAAYDDDEENGTAPSAGDGVAVLSSHVAAGDTAVGPFGGRPVANNSHSNNTTAAAASVMAPSMEPIRAVPNWAEWCPPGADPVDIARLRHHLRQQLESAAGSPSNNDAHTLSIGAAASSSSPQPSSSSLPARPAALWCERVRAQQRHKEVSDAVAAARREVPAAQRSSLWFQETLERRVILMEETLDRTMVCRELELLLHVAEGVESIAESLVESRSGAPPKPPVLLTAQRESALSDRNAWLAHVEELSNTRHQEAQTKASLVLQRRAIAARSPSRPMWATASTNEALRTQYVALQQEKARLTALLQSGDTQQYPSLLLASAAARQAAVQKRYQHTLLEQQRVLDALRREVSVLSGVVGSLQTSMRGA